MPLNPIHLQNFSYYISYIVFTLKGLLKKEEGLFFDKAQIDADTEQEIQELTDKKRFRVNIECYFKLNYSCKRD